MKKILFFALLLFSLSISVSARPGDIAGEYYATDIKTYLNGVQIDAINIGGQTLISAEQMSNYGFSVVWNSETRTLNVRETTGVPSVSSPKIKTYSTPNGSFAGYYYETDIVTYLDGIESVACNTDGHTYIHAENMRTFGYEVIWNEAERSLNIISPKALGHIYSLQLTEGKEKSQEGEGFLSVSYKNGVVALSGDADYCDVKMSSGALKYTFALSYYQNAGLFYSSKILSLLTPLCHDGYDVEAPVEPSTKYQDVSQYVSININGHTSEMISITSGAGNGHRDFYITAHDLPKLPLDKINTIELTIRNTPKQ